MSAPITPTSGTGTNSNPPAAPTTTPSIDKNMFLQLLVAQLKNQNPLSPTDSMQFVQQLAQFQQLEQTVNTGQDVSEIRNDLDQLTGNTGTGAASQT